MEQKVQAVAIQLSRSEFYDVTDDAVMGCLLESTVQEVMPELGLNPENKEDRKIFSRALDIAITL